LLADLESLRSSRAGGKLKGKHQLTMHTDQLPASCCIVFHSVLQLPDGHSTSSPNRHRPPTCSSTSASVSCSVQRHPRPGPPPLPAFSHREGTSQPPYPDMTARSANPIRRVQYSRQQSCVLGPRHGPDASPAAACISATGPRQSSSRGHSPCSCGRGRVGLLGATMCHLRFSTARWA